MTSPFGILNIARQGIYVNQSALQVTGNNIANVNTDGYSRQRAVMESIQSGGVRLSGIQRMTDQYLITQMRQSNARLGASSTMASNLSQIETALGESDESGLSQTISDFFSALQDLTLRPNGTTERESVRSRSQQLASSLSSVATQLRQIRKQIDRQVVQQVDQVNALTSEVADLNTQIVSISGNPDDPRTSTLNSLLDRRDQILSELSSVIPVRLVQNDNGSTTVFGGDSVLVESNTAFKLKAIVDPSNDGYHAVGIADISGNLHDITSSLDEGSLGALIESRDVQGKQALDEVERLAARMLRDLNVQHRAGTGLDGSTGVDLFEGLEVSATGVWSNKGGAIASTTQILDDTALTFDDYEIRFTDASTFDVVDTTTGSTLSSGNAYVSGGAISFDGMRIVLSDSASGGPAAGDVFKVNSYSRTNERMEVSSAVMGNLSVIAAGVTSASGDNNNALALANLREAATMGQPATQTYEEYYNHTRLWIASEVSRAQAAEQTEVIAQQQIQSLADSVSGVSLDEEATNIIQYQRAFQASSRIVSAVDEMMQTLLSMF